MLKLLTSCLQRLISSLFNAMLEYEFDLTHLNPKQELFLTSEKRFVAYGGARGGGKSWALREKIVFLAFRYSGIRILLLRRSFGELRENHINVLRQKLKKAAKYNDTHKLFSFPNGSTIKLGYCAHENDVLQYQGQEYDIICIDEATQFTKYQFEVLTACLRGANNFPKRFYLTCNPGGVGHTWVKRLFVSRKFEATENPDDYEFIPATVFDNSALMSTDPGYVDMLNNLGDDLRAAWRDGNWDALAGQYFDEFSRAVHMIEPFDIPAHWSRYRALDYGLDCLACLWIAIDESHNYYVYREYAEKDKAIYMGCADILRLSEGEKITYTVAASDFWARSQESGRRKADLFLENGLHLLKGSNDRESGWLAVKELLRVVNGSARLRIFSNCTGLLEHLPALLRDRAKPTDCMKEPHEITHLPDALRYFASQYSYPAVVKQELTDLQKWREKTIRNGKRRK